MSKFQRRHYEAIAEVLGYTAEKRVRDLLTEQFVRMLKRDNPNFSPDRFRARVKQHAEGIIMR
tara:strand:+ start:361 stop:549 length:189 start_codon:yes stop_codon:yes gene_type:complete